MPTREEMSAKIERDLRERGLTPKDPRYAFVRQTLEDMNQGMADFDDELEALAERMTWLLNAATWTNVRPVGEFERFSEAKLRECEAAMAAMRQRWTKHLAEPRVPTMTPRPPETD